jgi:SAM-dependent methyltransferase
MIKEYWDDVDPANRPLEDGESEATVMVERPALKSVLPEDMSTVVGLAVGCMDHEPALEIARRGARLKVADPSEDALDGMFQRLALEGLHADLVVSSMWDMRPFGDGTFDVVTAESSIDEFADLDRVFTEFHRVLRPGGTLYLVLPHPLVSGGHAITGGTGTSQWLVDDYFSTTKAPNPRTTERYLNPLVRVGFTIERVHEPQPDPMTKGVNNTVWNLYNRIPQLLILVARKPE